ncbi:MAG TPA: hypothetical protein DDW49_09015, partial [Deltaproteobacteria bacterium]|nr:hypothetical protein [Deltaproteobacteria bacterium]
MGNFNFSFKILILGLLFSYSHFLACSSSDNNKSKANPVCNDPAVCDIDNDGIVAACDADDQDPLNQNLLPVCAAAPPPPPGGGAGGDADQDNDGFTPNEGDCDDSNAEINPDSTHAEIIGEPDYNCDGHIGKIGEALFVDSDVAASGTGEFNSPFKTLQEALDAANNDKHIIYVYKNDIEVNGTINITKAISLYGGVSCRVPSQNGDRFRALPSTECSDENYLDRNDEDRMRGGIRFDHTEITSSVPTQTAIKIEDVE